jgi:putative serine/threonine protein kinase
LHPQIESYSIPIEHFLKSPYDRILCYPEPKENISRDRINQLRNLGVDSIILQGLVEISGLKVLGKGCVSIVVVAKTSQGNMALKIRRLDANRESMEREADLLTKANSVSVGPLLHSYSQDFILMELIHGTNLVDWVKKLKGKGSTSALRRVYLSVLQKCWRLDRLRLDHGELSNLRKHVLVNSEAEILDFESASTERDIKNVTSAAQYLFIGGPVVTKTNKMLRSCGRDKLIEAMRIYKNSRSREAFEELLRVLKLQKPPDKKTTKY